MLTVSGDGDGQATVHLSWGKDGPGDERVSLPLAFTGLPPVSSVVADSARVMAL